MAIVLFRLARSALFRLDPETAHDVAFKAMCALGPAVALLDAGADLDEARTVMGIRFPNPVGLAAGMDKNAEYLDALAALVFYGRGYGLFAHPAGDSGTDTEHE